MKSTAWAGPLVCEIFLPAGGVEKLFTNAHQLCGLYHTSRLRKARGPFARRFEISMMWKGKGGAS